MALIEQEHYVTVYIAGATSKASLSSDTTLKGILSGISWVTTKPSDANTGGGGDQQGGDQQGGNQQFDKSTLNTGGQPTIGSITYSTSGTFKSTCYSGSRSEIKFIDSNTLELQTFTGCTGLSDGTGTGEIGYDFTISNDTLNKTTYDLSDSSTGSQSGHYGTMTQKYFTSSGVTYAGNNQEKHTAFYPVSTSVFWWQTLLADKSAVTSASMVTTKFY
jgi:hypothetical protein